MNINNPTPTYTLNESSTKCLLNLYVSDNISFKTGNLMAAQSPTEFGWQLRIPIAGGTPGTGGTGNLLLQEMFPAASNALIIRAMHTLPPGLIPLTKKPPC